MEFFMKVASSTTGSASQGLNLGMVIAIIVVICVIIAWFMAMFIITDIAEEKGYEYLKKFLWFIGLFGLIFTPAIIVAALPDKKQNASSNKTSKSVEEELPAI